MSVIEQLVVLSELGLVDHQLQEALKKKKILPEKADKAKSQANEAKGKVEALSAQHKELVLKRKELDAKLIQEKANLRKWEGRADKIKGEREYTALMSEIGSEKRLISDVETQILENMESLEKLNKESALAQNVSDEQSVVAEREWDQVKAEVETLDKAVGRLEQSREALKAKLPSHIAKRYSQIAERRGGQGTALVKNEVCQACMRMIPPELYLRIAAGEVIEQCPSCQRLLVTETMAFAHRGQLIGE
jgi:predicted  nucleic acid-binding Zn-ribbon protein